MRGKGTGQILCTSITLTSGEELKTNFTFKFAQAINHAEQTRKIYEKNKVVELQSI